MKAVLSRALLWGLRTLGTEALRKGVDVVGGVSPSTPRTRLHEVEYPLCPRCNREIEPSLAVAEVPLCRRCVRRLAIPKEMGVARDALLASIRQLTAEVALLRQLPGEQAGGALTQGEEELRFLNTQLNDLERRMEEEVSSILPALRDEWGAK